MSISARKQLILFLLVMFVLQTGFIYFDSTGKQERPFSELAREGRQVWHENNCQSCHQLYGFGGFLGPDLTNSAPGLTQARMDAILTVGYGQMPAFHLSVQERKALAQFLTEMDKTGVGQVKASKKKPAAKMFSDLILQISGEDGLTEEQALGNKILFEQNCISCHLPNPLANMNGPDLTRLSKISAEERILSVLTTGLPERGMPNFELNGSDRTAVYEILKWLNEHEIEIQHSFRSLTIPKDNPFLDLPWFEYE